MRRAILVGLILLGAATVASAQTTVIVNPSWVKFEVSPDHSMVDRYELAFFASATATDPITGVAVLDLGKPTPDAQGFTPEIAFNVKPVKFGKNMVVKVRAVATVDGTVFTSPWSTPSNPFDRAPGPANGVVVR